ncbi:hypothetical protein RB595_003941 [Gaeumannomyces hyphopodioides]
MTPIQTPPFDPAVVAHGEQIVQRTEAALYAQDKAFPDLSAMGFYMFPPNRQRVIKWSGGQHPLQGLPTTRDLTPESLWVTSATYYFVFGVLTATHDTDAGNLMVKSMNSTMFAEACPDLRMSDLLAFTWAHARGNENEYPRKPLRLLVMEEVLAVTRETSQHLILNTVEAMNVVFDALPGADGLKPCPRTERLTLRYDAAGELERRAFWYISAQPHVARVHMMLADYPQLFRHHRVEKIHLMQAEYPPPRVRDGEVWDPTWGRNIALELGPMEDDIEPFGCVSAALMVLPRRPDPPPKLDWDLAEGYEMPRWGSLTHNNGYL